MKAYAPILGGVVAFGFLMLVSLMTHTQPASWNDQSRVAAIESLVERGTWAIDDASWADETKDKVFLNGRFYSDKMPLFSVLGAGVYAVFHHLFGASLAPDCRVCAYAWVTRVLVGLPAALLLWLFWNFAQSYAKSLKMAFVGMLAFGMGTMIFPYAVVLNHHVPAACSVFASFYLLLTRRAHRQAIFVAGLLAALAVSFDVLAGIVAATVGVMALVRLRRDFVFFALGGAIPLVLTALLDYQIANTILPPYMLTEGYIYPDSPFPATFAGNGTPDDYAAYAFRMFLGGKGLFAFNPLLLFALVGALGVAFTRKHPLQIEAICVTLGFALLCVYLATQTGNYGGAAYGVRWFIPVIPLVFAFILFVPPLNQEHVWAWLAFVPLWLISVISSFQGSQAPWQDHLPIVQMTRDVSRFPIFGFKFNVRFP
jgi:hypothetical protein